MITGDPTPAKVEQATAYVDQLAEHLVASVDQSVDDHIRAQRDYLGGIVLYDSFVCGPVSFKADDVNSFDRFHDWRTLDVRLNERFFDHIVPAIKKHGEDTSGRLQRFKDVSHPRSVWRSISRLVATNICDANGRPVSETYDDVDLLKRLATGQVHVMPFGSRSS
jgi:hypothetical protein